VMPRQFFFGGISLKEDQIPTRMKMVAHFKQISQVDS